MAERYGPHIQYGRTIYVDKYLSKKPENLNGEYADKFVHAPELFANHVVPNNPIGLNHHIVVFNLVDNDNARKYVHSACYMPFQKDKNSRFKKHVTHVVDIGNEETHGQLFYTRYFVRLNMNEGFKGPIYNACIDESIFDYIPSAIANEEEVKVYSCADIDVDETKQDQFFVANDTAATVGHNWFVSLLSSNFRVIPKEIKFVSIPDVVVTTETKTVDPVLSHMIYDILNRSFFYASSGKITQTIFINSANLFCSKEHNPELHKAFMAYLKDMYKLPEFKAVVAKLNS